MKGNGQTGHGGRFVVHYPDIPDFPPPSKEEIERAEASAKRFEENPDREMKNFWNSFGGGLKK